MGMWQQRDQSCERVGNKAKAQETSHMSTLRRCDRRRMGRTARAEVLLLHPCFSVFFTRGPKRFGHPKRETL
jgi:hypothetical protein